MKRIKSISALTCCLVLVLFNTKLHSEQVTVIRADRMLDVVSGNMVLDAVVTVEGTKILSVGNRNIPSGAETIDLGDMTLLPGFIDMHTHLSFDIEGDWVNAAVKRTAADAALRGARNALRTLKAGFTTVREILSMYR